jgi:hypothetical protein
MDVHAVAWESTEGPRVKTCPPPGRPYRPGLYHEAPLPSVRAGRGRQASTRAGDHSSTR